MSERNSGSGAVVGGGAIYGLGIIGAWFWFWSQAEGFWGYVWAIVEGLFWPAFMVYKLFAFLHH